MHLMIRTISYIVTTSVNHGCKIPLHVVNEIGELANAFIHKVGCEHKFHNFT